MSAPVSARRPRLGALLLVTGTSALSTDTYLSSLPAVQSSLRTTASVAQLTVTAFIIGMAIGQLVAGPVSDARGRRTLVLAACVVFTVTTAACAFATDGGVLVALRTLGGLAAGTTMAVGRAVVGDTHRGRDAAALFGTISAVGLVAPVVGPAIGGTLAGFGSWRTVFGFLALVGVAMSVAAFLGLPESLPTERRQPGGVTHLRRRTADLLTDRHVAVPVAVQCLTVAGFFVYIGGSSFVLQDDLGLSARGFTAVFTTNAVTMVLASTLFRVLVGRHGAVVLRRVAVSVQTGAVVALAGACLLAPDHRPGLAVVWTCLAVMTAGLGMYLPANSSIVQHAGRRAAGTASALGGGLPFLAGALTTPLTGLLGRQTVPTMAGLMVVFFAFAAVVAVLGRHATVEPVGDDDPVAAVPADAVSPR